jgi:hypothetical protein
MSDQGLLEAFNDCLDRINAGQSLNDCLSRYPQYAAALRPMLEVGKLVERAQVSPFEVDTAQARVRARMVEQLRVSRQKSAPAYARLALLAASLVITLAAVIGMAQASLPGDSLYGLKRLSEGALSLVTSDQFAARRQNEVRSLLALRRPAQVEFTGEIERIIDDQWTVAGLVVRVPAAAPKPQPVAVGDQVRVEADTTDGGELIARSLALLETDQQPSPTQTTVATIKLSPTSSPSPIITATTTPLSTNMPLPPTSSPSPQPTSRAVSRTAIPTNIVPPTTTPSSLLPTATLPPTVAATVTPTACVPSAPVGWVGYLIQTGDTVAGLAAMTGTSVEQLVTVNCLPQTLMIIAGDTLFLPSQLPTISPATTVPVQPSPSPSTLVPTQEVAQGGSDSSGSGSGGDDREEDNSGPGGGGGGGGDDDHGGSSGEG